MNEFWLTVVAVFIVTGGPVHLMNLLGYVALIIIDKIQGF